MIQLNGSPLWNHLWQSTLFAAFAALLTLLLRNNRAQTRYWLWLGASLKFLIPFSLLVGIGARLDLFGTTPAALALPPAPIGLFGQVFAPSVQNAVATPAQLATPSSLPMVLSAIWAFGLALVLFAWFREWRRIHMAVNQAVPLNLDIPVRAVSSNSILEPAVAGIWGPVLLLPEGIADRLTPPQLTAILAHELCHIRRRDNLFAAVHMAVEAVFWFHPLVWWIGRRLVAERERACDEEVVRLGSEPAVYAEAILKVCRFYLESPLACIAGVTGSNLRRRIRAIVAARPVYRLDLSRKALLATAAAGTLAAPIVFGVLNAPFLRAQTRGASPVFEVASVKPDKLDFNQRRPSYQVLPGGRLVVTNVPLLMLIAFAYHVPFQSPRLSGGPDWIRSERFDIEGVPEKNAIPAGAATKDREEAVRQMLRNLLADRFHVAVRTEVKEAPVYAIVAGKRGLKLARSKTEEKDCTAEPTKMGVSCHNVIGGMGRGIHGEAVSLDDVAHFVENWTDRPVLDMSGIPGLFNIQTDGWAPLRPMPQTDSEEGRALADPTRLTIFEVFEQLGLKLEPRKAPVETYLIERAERPSEN